MLVLFIIIIMYVMYIYAFINVRLNVIINILKHMNYYIYWVFIYVRAFRYIKLSQYDGDNRSIVMPGYKCIYIYMTKHKELGPLIGITRAATSTGYTND